MDHDIVATEPAPLSILAVHGNGGGGARFDPMRPFLPPGIEFAAPDLPGFGTAADVDPERLTMRDLGDAVREAADALPRPLVVLGHGIGGSFVLEALQADPDAFDAVILHAPVGAHLDRRTFPRLMRSRAARRTLQWGLSSRWTRPLVRRRLLRSRAVPDDVVARFFEDYGRCRAFGRMFDVIDAPWFDGLRPAALPATLLWGGRERVLDPSHARAFQELLPAADIVVEAAWDHFPMIDTPRAYADRVVELARALVRSPVAPAGSRV